MQKLKAREARTQQLNISLTRAELEDITKRAFALGMLPSHFGRAILLAGEMNTAETSRINQVDRIAHQHLMRVGTYLSQLLRHLQRSGDIVPADLEPLLVDIREIV